MATGGGRKQQGPGLGFADEGLRNPGQPLLGRRRIEVTQGVEVQLTTVEGHVYIGIVAENPVQTSAPDWISLRSSVATDTRTGAVFRHPGLRKFHCDEIKELKVTLVTEPQPTSPTSSQPQPAKEPGKSDDVIRREYVMLTRVILRTVDVEDLFRIIDEKKVDKIIVCGKLHGSSVGRFADLSWICMVVRGLLVSIDVKHIQEFEEGGGQRFWKVMEDRLFKNDKILKIFHGCRRLLDYLFHTKSIPVDNLFDTQIAEAYIDYHQYDGGGRAKEASFSGVYQSVVECYKKFIPSVPLKEEIEFLEKYNAVDKTKSDGEQFLQRPPQTENACYKATALEMKYMMQLYEEQMNVLLSHYKICVLEEMKLAYRGSGEIGISQKNVIPDNVRKVMRRGNPLFFSLKEDAVP